MSDERDQIAPELAKLKELEAKLDTYKSTLIEIYEQYDQKLEELSLVRRMGDALRSTQGLEALSRSLLENVAHEVAVDRLALMLAHEKKPGQLLIRAAYWADQEIFSFFEPTLAVPWSLNRLGSLAPEDGWPSLLTIASAAPKYDPLGRPDDSARSLVFLPLTVVRRRLLGLLVLSRPDSRPFSPEDERMLAIMGDQAGAALSNVLLFDDLTRVNQRLTDSESRARQVSEYLQRLLETANDAMFTLNDRGVITYANRKAAQWGWTREELLGREFRSFLAESDLVGTWKPGGPPPADEVFEAVLINAAGARRDLILSTSRVGGEDAGPVLGGDWRWNPDASNTWGSSGRATAEFSQSETSWMVLANDMTERKYLERQLIHSEKLASIGLLAAGVAHEVGNPLSAISGYAQILEDGGNSEEERREYLAAIINQTGRIQKILRELLDYSRPSTGQSEILDLAEALPRTMGMIQAQRVFRNVEVSFDLDEAHTPHLVYMDRDHLAQITIIIAMNAAQAMNGEGRFHIALSRASKGPGAAARPPVEPGDGRRRRRRHQSPPDKSQGSVRLRFTDSGPGIPQTIVDRLFDPFFTTKSPGEGTGLGLSICQRLVDSYLGRIDIESGPDQGASFIISLPEYTEVQGG